MTHTVTIRGNEYILLYELNLADVSKQGEKRVGWKSAVAIVLLLVLGLASGMVIGKFFGKVIISTNLAVLLPVVASTFVIHEAIHGFFFWTFGGKPTFGMKVIGGWKNFLWGLVLYATADAYYTRSQYLIIGLSPLVLISVLAVVASVIEPLQSYAILAGSANALGAVGDIYMTAKLAKFPSDVLVRDTADGYQIYQRATALSTDFSPAL